MRGEQDSQIESLTTTSPGKRVPATHPIREIKRLADQLVEHEVARQFFEEVVHQKPRLAVPDKAPASSPARRFVRGKG
jgi:hypothetical protein